MTSPFRSLRFKLVMTFVLVVGAINAALAAAALAVRDYQLRTGFDQRLVLQADRLALWLQPRIARTLSVEALLRHPARPLAEDEWYVQLRRSDGSAASRTQNLRDSALPLPARLADLPAGPYFQTLHGEGLSELRGRPDRVRVFTRRLTVGTDEYLLQVGRDLDEIDDSLSYLRNLLWLAMPVALVVAGFAGWIVIGGAIRSLREVSQTAMHITPAHLDERIRIESKDSDIQRLVTELNRMLDRLSTSFKSQQRFIANASHALQTPVTALLAEAQVLRNGTSTEADCRRFVVSVEEEMRQLTKMIGSLLSLIRLETGEVARAEATLSLNDVLVAALDEVRAGVDAKSLRLRLNLPEPDAEVEPNVTGDAGLLQTMVENLLRNATRYAPESSTVGVTLDVDVDQAVLTIEDAGPTLSDMAIRSVFDRDPASTPAVAGRRGEGLSLAIAKSIAELHDGTVGVRNRTEGGVAFFVWLPLAKPGISTG